MTTVPITIGVCVCEKRDNRGRVQCATQQTKPFLWSQNIIYTFFLSIASMLRLLITVCIFLCMCVYLYRESYVCDLCTVLYGAACLKMHFIQFLFLFFYSHFYSSNKPLQFFVCASLFSLSCFVLHKNRHAFVRSNVG